MATSYYRELNWLVDRVLDPYARIALQLMLPILEDKEPVTMADITQALSDLDAAVSGVAQRAASDHADLQSQIDALKAQGVDTGALQAAADRISANVQQLNAIDVPSAPTQTSTPDAPVTPEPAPVDSAPVPDAGGTEAPVDQTPDSPVVDTPTPDAPVDTPAPDAPVDATPAPDAPAQTDGTV